MSPDLALSVSIEASPDSVEQTKEVFASLPDRLIEKWDNWEDTIVTSLKTQTDALFTDIGKAWDKTTESWGSIAGDAIKDSLGPIFSGEMDDLGEIWDNAWDKMGASLESLWDSILNSLLDRFLGFVADLGKNFILDPLLDWGSDLFTSLTGIDLGTLFDWPGTIKDFFSGIFDDSGMSSVLGDMFDGVDISDMFGDFGISDMLGDFGFGDISSGMDSVLGDMFGGFDMADMFGDFGISDMLGDFGFGDLSSGMDSVLGDMFGDFGMADMFGDFGLDSMLSDFGFGDMFGGMDSVLGDMFGGMDLGFTDMFSSFSDLMGGFDVGFTDMFSGVTDLFGSGSDLLSGLEGIFGGSGGLSSLLGGAGIFGGVELFAGMMGMPGPIEGITNAIGEIFGFSDGGGYTPEEAREKINADIEYFGRATQAMQESLANGGPESTVFVEQMRDLAIHIERIADIAGYSQEELDAMVDSLGPWGSAMVETSQVSSLMNEELGNMIQRFQGMGGEMSHTIESEQQLRGSLAAMVEALAASELNVEGMGEAVNGLADDFLTGQITAEELAEGLDSVFLTALTEAAAQGEISAEQMRELADSIMAIPTMTTAEVHTYYVDHHSDVYDDGGGDDGDGGGEERHLGGLVLHQGGMVAPRYHAGSLVTSLAADEVPIIARRGEYVVRAESVTASTLPWLQALNQTGAGPAGAPSPPTVNLHVEVHGNLLGSEEDLEELARLIGGKLEELERYRHRAA